MKAIVFDQVENSTKSVLNKFQDCDSGFFSVNERGKIKVEKIPKPNQMFGLI